MYCLPYDLKIVTLNYLHEIVPADLIPYAVFAGLHKLHIAATVKKTCDHDHEHFLVTSDMNALKKLLNLGISICKNYPENKLRMSQRIDPSYPSCYLNCLLANIHTCE